MEPFQHLKFVQKVTGKPRFFGGGSPNERSEKNKANRKGHSETLSHLTTKVRTEWQVEVSKRAEQQLAPLDENIIPIFLQINPELINSGFELKAVGIEIISEEDDGFIIGASLDGLKSLEEKIRLFAQEKYGGAKISELWEIIAGNREAWKPERILSEELLEKWGQVQDDVKYKLEVSIAFDKPLRKEPDPTKRGGEKRLLEYRQMQVAREEELLVRENHFDTFINQYGQRNTGLIHLEDSFGCEVEISGKGLKDLVFNYPFVFEVAEVEQIGTLAGSSDVDADFELEVLPPAGDSPEIGVIDSGMMEGHKYLAPAIKPANSRSYIDGDASTVDQVKGGGHGTKVAGAILYPTGITTAASPYQLPCFVRNLRVLDGDNFLVTKYPAILMKTIVEDNVDCTIFNLSINSTSPFRKKHMSTWAATIDALMHSKNVLFIISAGNVLRGAIRYYLNHGEAYPGYLKNAYCRLANPAQSCFALTVGSVNHFDFEDDNWKSLGAEGNISAYSRIGCGIWGQIKPDVVEHGGGLIVSKNGMNLVKENEFTAPELLRSTTGNGAAYGKDSIGTSFAAPKVTHIVAELKKLYPDDNANLLRALVIQGARLPNEFFLNPTADSIHHFGYGLPSLTRVTANSDYRVSFYNTGEIAAEEGHIYLLKIPDELRDPGNEYDVLIEVTLAYTANVRRTRQKTKSYVSTPVDWEASKIDEPFDDFKDYILKEIEKTATSYDKEARKKLESYDWKIRSRSDHGEVIDMNRNESSAQKDWAILKSHQLPREFSIAVRAHKGWDKNFEQVPYALTVSIELLNADIPIYELIRVENEIEAEV